MESEQTTYDKTMKWARYKIVFQTGGYHGMRWQIVHLWGNDDKSNRVLFVGREIGPDESLKRPPLDMQHKLEENIQQEFKRVHNV